MTSRPSKQSSAAIRTVLAEPLERRQLMAATLPAFVQTNLVSDGAVTAAHIDANLVNPWGIAVTSFGTIWVSNAGTSSSTVYDQAGTPGTPTVTFPLPGGAPGISPPTGVVFNTSKSFNLPGTTTPALYIYSTLTGTIAAWGPSLGATAAVAVDSSATAIYTGIAIAGKGKKAVALASNFGAGRIDVYNSSFQPVTLASGAFVDPILPAGYSPYNVQTIKNKVYVAYALRDSQTGRDTPGVGNGYVDVFNTKGKLVQKLASGGALNSPWGLTAFSAPGIKNAILVGNFGDGTINAFSTKGTSLGTLKDTNGTAIVNDHLWGIQPGVGSSKTTLFFAAGINNEQNGLFGTLVPQKPVKRTSSNTGDGGGGFGY